jgi:hypothetical protein
MMPRRRTRVHALPVRVTCAACGREIAVARVSAPPTSPLIEVPEGGGLAG